jgi:hypothetical protein
LNRLHVKKAARVRAAFFIARASKYGYNTFIMEAPSPRDELIILFLRGLRIVLNNAAAYAVSHPYFQKSVQEFREKITPVFDLLDPVWIHCAPDSLMVDGRPWQKNALYTDLAALFHYRKIKSVGFAKGVTVDELLAFFGVIGMPRRDFLRKGGCRRLLKGLTGHILVEELDYSGFLGEGGTVEVDVWVFLLGEALERDDTQKLKNLADTFGKVAASLKPSDLAEDTELHDNIRTFMRYVKEHYREKLRDCTRELFGVMERYKTALKSGEIEKIKTFFREIDEESLARLLWDELLDNKSFDTTSFRMYNQLVEPTRHQAVANVFESLAGSGAAQETQAVVKRLGALLETAMGDSFSAVYRTMLAHIMEQLSFIKHVDFDRARARKNYSFILLSLLQAETVQERIAEIIGRIGKEWERITKERDYDFIVGLAGVIRKKQETLPACAPVLGSVRSWISNFVETVIWIEPLPEEHVSLLDEMSSSLEADRFILKMAEQEMVNTSVVTVFLRLFPQAVGQLQSALAQKSHNVDFMMKFVSCLKKSPSPLVGGILESIFPSSNDFIKIEALKVMESLATINEVFLFAVLNQSTDRLKRAAFSVLAQRDSTRQRALEKLFNVPSFLGSGNKIMLEHLAMVGELALEKEAYAHVEVLAKRPFFWNKPVREKAKMMLEKMYARKH